MLRFRTVQDEKRYLTLMTEVYLRLGQSGISPTVVSEILRNLGKIEAFVFHEGVRQGVIAGILQQAESADPSAQDLHFSLYGSAETPLTRCEESYRTEHKIFDETPVRFAPLTLQEAIQEYGTDLQPAALRSADIDEAFTPEVDKEIEDMFNGDDDARDHVLELSGVSLEELEKMLAPKEQDETHQAPESLDRMRDELQRLLKSGWKPKDYPEVVLALQASMHADAVFIDLQLGSEQGRAVLAQVGLMQLPLIPMDDGAEIKFLESLP